MKNTAQNLLTNNVPVVGENATIADAEALLTKKAEHFETINYIFVVDSQNRLKGAISLKEIFRSPKHTKITTLLDQKIISVHMHATQEHVALLALKNNLKSVPVVDSENHFLGVVPYSAILHALDSEAVENLLRFGGIMHKGSYDNVFNITILQSLKHRLPWLILGLIGGLLAASVVNFFEKTLAQNLILAAFIPLVVYMSDAVGTQMEAFIIRDLAIEPKMRFIKYFFRQLMIITVVAAIISLFTFAGTIAIYQNITLSFVLATALFMAVISSILTGLIIPFLFNKIKLDPANASGPIATIIQDLLSVIIYFSIAQIIL